MYTVLFITASSAQEAQRIAQGLVKEKLVACVNMIENMTSVFWWEAKVDSAKEVLLIAKTTKAKLSKITALVKSLHSYQVPEIIALPIIGGYKPYLEWIDESLR
jgi:periplasmic divalent cation tolerance protein